MKNKNFKIRRYKFISYQVVRIQTFGKGDLSGIGRETERTAKNNRNEDIDRERTPLNFYFKKSEGGMNAQWKTTMENLDATFREKKDSVAFEGMIITSDSAFFEKLGYVPGLPPPPEVKEFFERAYAFALRYIGYHGTDENILSAVVHYDETTPHLQLYYLPLVETAKKKVYALDKDGKVLRNAKGSPVQMKDENGKSLYEYVKLEQPKLCSSDFWAERGGQHSYGNMQDEFYEAISVRYGLERGEVGSNKRHTTKYEWQMKKQQAELDEANRKLQNKNTEIAIAEDKLEKVEMQADAAESRQVHTEEAMQALEEKREKLEREVEPLQVAAEVLQEYSDGKRKLNKRDLPVIAAEAAKLKAENGQLEQQLEVSRRDQHDVFTLYQKSEQLNRQLKGDADTLRTLREHAPDKLKEALAAAEQRKTAKHSSPFKGSGSNRGGK